MLRTAEPSFERAIAEPFELVVIVNVDILADRFAFDSHPARAVRRSAPLRSVMIAVVTNRHVQAVAARNHCQSRREFQRLQPAPTSFSIYLFDDFGFRLADPGHCLG